MDFYLFAWAFVFGGRFAAIERFVRLLRRTSSEILEGLVVWVGYCLLCFNVTVINEFIIFILSYFVEPKSIFSRTNVIIIGKLSKSNWALHWTLFILFFTQSCHAVTIWRRTWWLIVVRRASNRWLSLALQFAFFQASWLSKIMSFLQEISSITLLMYFGNKSLSFQLFLLVINCFYFGSLSLIVSILYPLLVWIRHRIDYFMHFEQFFIIDLSIQCEIIILDKNSLGIANALLMILSQRLCLLHFLVKTQMFIHVWFPMFVTSAFLFLF